MHSSRQRASCPVGLPLGETNSPPGWQQSCKRHMTTVFIADTRAEERFALSLMMRGLHLAVVGAAPDWATTVAKAPASGTEMLLIDWDIIPRPSSAALDALR